SVDPNHDDADALITRLQAFAGDLLAIRNIALRFSADPALKEWKLTSEQRRNLFLISKEVLYNTLKYADARTVEISITAGHRSLILELRDDGCGFDPANTDSYNGNGLLNMRNRARAIDAQFTLESSPGNGTRVRVVVPQKATPPRSGD
ncbi:MAG: ATP-binding protein, partial [Flavobacteriales bacterium]